MFVFSFIITDIFFVNVEFLYLINKMAYFFQLEDLHKFSIFQNKRTPARNCFANCELLLLLLKEIKFSLNLALTRRSIWPT